MAVEINANGEFIDVAANAKFNFTPVDQDRTFACWWKSSVLPDANGETQIFFGLVDDDGNRFLIQLYYSDGIDDGTTALFVTVHDSDWVTIGYFYHIWEPSVNTWYQITAKIGNNSTANCEFFVDGADLGNVTLSSWGDNTQITPDSVEVNSGGKAVSDDYTISHVVWFGDLLTAGEIGEYRWQPSWACGNGDLLFYCPMDELTGATVADYSDTPTNGTLTDGASLADGPPVFESQSVMIL